MKFDGKSNNFSPQCTLMWHSKANIFFLLFRKFTVCFAPTICNFVTRLHALPCALHLKIIIKTKQKIKGLLPSDKEENQTLARSLILSSNAHDKSSYLPFHHGKVQECK
jgi:hypothetical protein